MRKLIFTAVTLSLVIICFNPPMPAIRAQRQQAPYIPDEIIIGFRPDVALPMGNVSKVGSADLTNAALVSLDQIADVIQIERLAPVLPSHTNPPRHVTRHKQQTQPATTADIAAIFAEYGIDRMTVVRLAKPMDIPQLAAELMQQYPDLIEFAEPNYLHAPALRPNDPLFSSQWYLTTIQAPAAWDVTTGDAGVVVAVIDTGISPHVDLDTKRFRNLQEVPGNGVDDDSNGFVDDVSGWDFFSGDNNPLEESSVHGTPVSGVIAAATNNQRHVAGVSWASPILPLRACCTADGYFSTSAEIRAINYATLMSTQGVRVINMSFGGAGRSSGVLRAIQAAGAAKILCVASAGNEASDNDVEQHYPSGFETETDNVLGVAATNASDRLSSYSNYGLSVGVAAPGDAIRAIMPGNTSTSQYGTSFSAPIVSGIAALIYSRFPASTPLQVRGRIIGNVDPVAALKGKVLSEGRVNAARVFEVDEVPPAPITDMRVITGQSGPMLTWTATGDDGEQGRASFYDIRYLSQPITPENFRFARKWFTTQRPAPAGTTETLPLSDSFPTGRYYVLIRVLDNVGNVAEANQVEVIKE